MFTLFLFYEFSFMKVIRMPSVFLSPSTQEFNPYVIGGNEELYMNRLADLMEPYLRSSGIKYTRNDPAMSATQAVANSNSGKYDVHLALHTNAAPDKFRGKLRGIDVYYAPSSRDSQRLATIIANNLASIYPLPDKSRALPTSTLGEVLKTRAVAVLAEIGYHDNMEDAEWLRDNLQRIAINLVQSLCDYFGIPFIEAGAVMDGTVVTDRGSRVNIRRYPSSTSEIIGSIPDDSSVSIYGKYGNWYVIGYNNIIGYASSDYVVMG